MNKRLIKRLLAVIVLAAAETFAVHVLRKQFRKRKP